MGKGLWMRIKKVKKMKRVNDDWMLAGDRPPIYSNQQVVCLCQLVDFCAKEVLRVGGQAGNGFCIHLQ